MGRQKCLRARKTFPEQKNDSKGGEAADLSIIKTFRKMKLAIITLAAVQAIRQPQNLKDIQTGVALEQEDAPAAAECQDTSNGAEDSYGDGCAWYDSNPSGCGSYNTADFTAETMCCGCQYDYQVSAERR